MVLTLLFFPKGPSLSLVAVATEAVSELDDLGHIVGEESGTSILFQCFDVRVNQDTMSWE